ncbi:MAG: ABC transporter permease [Lachnospiraceae bacterium]|nr:ABC transporter permease [Lachnospiraceae bacterium]
MSNVNNKKAIRKISFSGITTNIKKYIVLVVAVALTSLLFTALFTIGGSLVKEMQLSTMRQVGGSNHAGFKYLTQEEYDMVKDDEKLKSISYRITVGDVANKELNKLRTEVNYFEPDNAKGCFCYPEVGNMPEKENEIVTSDLVLQKLGVPVEVGSKVSLTFNIGGNEVSDEFIVSGYYRGDVINCAQMMLVSKAFQEKYAPVKTTTLPETHDNDYVGWIMADFDYDNSFNIQKKTDALIERTGIREDVDCGINWAYVGGNFDAGTIVLVGVMLVTIFLSGYLIIYNIFYINVVSDIREYGLLKTIGTTTKQLKKVVKKRARIISVIGIPLGILPGILIGVCILPMISKTLTTVSIDKGQAHLNIWIILVAAVFTYVTVMVSAVKPCKKAGSVSPIEALRTTESDVTGRKSKKGLVVVLSLSLALVILNSVMSIVKGFSMDEYVEELVVADYSVQDATLDNPSFTMEKVLDGVTKEFLDELNERTEIEEIGNIYSFDDYHEIDDKNWNRIHDKIITNQKTLDKIAQMYNGKNGVPTVEEYVDMLDERKELDGATYGVSKMVFDKLKVIKTIDGSDKMDWDTFNSGNYVLVNCYKDNEDNIIAPFFEPGDKISVASRDEKYVTFEEGYGMSGEVYEVPNYDNEPTKEYEVYAVVEIPYAVRLQMFGEFQCDYILSEEEFLSLNGNRAPMRTLVDVKDDKEQEFEEWLASYTTSVNQDLTYKSKQTVLEEYKSFNDMIKVVGVTLSIVLGIIGLLNFANTMISSIIVRARELAVLEAVGMTGGQQKKKLMKEGLVYFGWTALFSIVLSVIMNVTLIRAFVTAMPAFTWKFTITPVLLCLPIIGVLIAIIPIVAHARMCRTSIVDRLRFE